MKVMTASMFKARAIQTETAWRATKRQMTVGFHANVMPWHAPRDPEKRGKRAQL